MSEMTLAVDPGVTTGFAVFRGADLLAYGEEPHLDFLDRAAKLIEEDGIGKVVCEDFLITAATLRKTRQTSSLEQIGALRWMCSRRGIPFVLQPPSAKKIASRAKLEALGWYKPSRGGHQNDAISHGLAYLIMSGELDPAELVRRIEDR